jgi:hypothetical protein
MMMRRRLIVLGAAVGLIAAGCSHSSTARKPALEIIPSAEQQPPADTAAQETSKPKVDQMDANAGSADALAYKAQNYAKQIAPLVEARTSARPGAAPALTPQTDKVEWLDPADFRLGAFASTSGSSHPTVPLKPVIVTTPGAANQPVQAANTAGAENPSKGPAGDALAVATPAPAPAVSTETKSASNTSAAISTDALDQKLSRRAKDFPKDVSAQLEYQLLEFLRDEPTPQLAMLSSLPSEDRELVSAVLDGLANFRNALRADNNMLLSRKIKPLLDMSERLRSQADLMIPTIALCRSVTTFGNYEPIEPARFAADHDHQVIVYCEVANFTSNLNDKQLWETRLNWDMTLFTEAGIPVWSDKTETIVDSARVRRHDFFVRKAITIPKNLSIGRYLLKASLVDSQSNRVAEATTPIVIAAQNASAGE